MSSAKIDKYQYLTSIEILPFHHRRMIEQSRFTYSPPEKTFEKQIKMIQNQGEKQIKAIQEHGKHFAESNVPFFY